MTLAILARAFWLTSRSLRYRDTVLTATPARSATIAMFGFRFIWEPARDFIRKHRRPPVSTPTNIRVGLSSNLKAEPVHHIAHSSIPDLVIHKPAPVRTATPD